MNGWGKVVDKELCKILKFDHSTKWCIHKPESVRENDIYNILWDSEIQIDHLISTRRSDLVLIRKKRKEKRTGHIVDIFILLYIDLRPG